MPIFISKWGM